MLAESSCCSWLAPSLRSCKDNDVVMVDRGSLTWAPVSLSTDRVVFGLGTETEHHDVWTVIHTDSVTRIEHEGNLAGSQGRFRLLDAECISRIIPIEYLCESISEWIAHVEKVETTRGFGLHQFWNELRIALSLVGLGAERRSEGGQRLHSQPPGCRQGTSLAPVAWHNCPAAKGGALRA